MRVMLLTSIAWVIVGLTSWAEAQSPTATSATSFSAPARSGVDTCPGVSVGSLPFADSGTTCGLADTLSSYTGSCTLFGSYPGEDAIYEITLGESNMVGFSLDLSGSTGDLALALIGTCGDGTSCVSNSFEDIGVGVDEIIPAASYSAGTYYLYIDSAIAAGNPGSCGSYTLSITGTLGDVLDPPLFSKSFSPNAITAGSVSTLTFNINNSANAASVSNLAFIDDLPPGVVIATPSNVGGNCSGTPIATSGGTMITYSGGTVAASTNCTVSVDVTSSAVGDHLNTTGVLTSDAGNSGTASATLSVTQAPELDLVKGGALDPGDDGVATPGDLINYTFVVTNTGNVTLTDISVSDPLVSSIICPSGNPILTLAPLSMATCTGSYAITQADVDAGQRDNTATADSNETPPVTDNHMEAIPQVLGLELVKAGALDLGGDGVANPDDLINYTFVVSNTGNVTLTGVSVSDPIVSPISCPSGNPIPTLAPSSTETCTGSYAITQADIDAGQKDNTATADSNETTRPVTDDHMELIPGLGLVKDGALDLGDDGVAKPDDLIAYTFVVTNSTSGMLTDVSVSDPLVSSITCPGGNPIPTLAPAETETCTGSYAITQADIDAGQKDNTATADSNETPSVADDHMELIPGLGLVMDGMLDLGVDGVATPGDLIDYTLVVTNSTSGTLTGVQLSDPLLSSITCPSGNPILVLAPLSMEICTGSYEITQADIDAGQKDNTATAESNETLPVTDDHMELIPQAPGLDLVKDGALDPGDDSVATPGDLINYTFVVTNTGNVTLTDISVSDPLVSSIICPSGNPILTLAPLSMATCTGSYAITQADIDAGQKDNTATADSNEAPPVTDDHVEVFTQVPVLNLVKDGALDLGGDGVANPDDLINYTFVVTNTGNVTLTGISVSDPLVSPITCPSGNPIPTLVPEATETCTGSYAITQADIDAGQKDNTATADSNEAPPATDDHMELIPGLGLVKDGALDLGDDGVAKPDDLIAYTFVVTNSTSGMLTDVSVSDPLVSSITCPGGNPIPTLAPLSMETCTGSYAITQADIDAGQKDNTATAESLETPSVTDDHIELIPGLSVVKDGALDLGGDGVATPGDLIAYTFVVTNSSSGPLTGVELSDPLVSSISCPSGNPIPTLAPLSMEICTGSYAITQADIDAGQKDNTATAESHEIPPVTGDHMEPIPQAPGLGLVKAGALDPGGDGVANPGDLIAYTFVVTNTGNVTLTDISVSDPLVSSIICPSGNPILTLAPAATEICTGSYAITQADIDAGQKDNTATADSNETSPVTGDHMELIPQVPGLDLVKAGALDLGGDGVANPGDLIAYMFVVGNTGNVTLTSVSVSDPLVSPINCPSGNPIPTLAPAATETCTGSYAIIQADIDAGQKDNTATADSNETAPVTDDHMEPILQVPGLELVKAGALDLGGNGVADPGDLIEYTFVMTNTGNVTLTGVSVSDPLVSSITCPSGDPIPTLAPSSMETCIGSYAITQADIDSGQKDNTATAGSNETPSVTDDHMEPIPQEGTITIVKNALPDDAQDFGFSSPLGSFTLDDDADGALQNSRSFTVSPGSYTVTEIGVAGWQLTSIVCDDSNSTGNISTATATLNLEAGEQVTCTFTNTLHLGRIRALVVPGFEVEVDDPSGPTTLFAIRNTTDADIQIDVGYHGEQVGEPLRVDNFMLGPHQTLTRDVRSNLAGLNVSDGFATGLIVIAETGGDASGLEGDYFHVDSANDFATGDRLVRTEEFCAQQEIRFVDFGSGSRLQILLGEPRGAGEPSFSYTVYNEAGTMITEGDVVASAHLMAIDVNDLVPGQKFGTVVFDFSNAAGGFVTAEYSAFGRYSVELDGTCRPSTQPRVPLAGLIRELSEAKGGIESPNLNLSPKACVIDTLACNSTLTGNLTANDCPLGDGTVFDQWTFAGTAGATVTIDIMSDDFDPFLFLLDPTSAIVGIDDDRGPGYDSRIVRTLDSTGTWSIAANNFSPGLLGEYTSTLACEGEKAAGSQLVVPGFEVEVANPEGPTTLFAVRNTTGADLQIDIAYHDEQIAGVPLRTDNFTLEPQQTLTRDVRNDLSDLTVSNGFATGLIVITETGGDASDLEGDYFRIDSENGFATGDRLVRSEEYCAQQEIRFVDFGSESRLQILVEEPQGADVPSFSYTAVNEQGTMIAEDNVVTSEHLTVVDVDAWVPGHRFGTLIFDFSSSGGGFVTARYSAFGRYSVELNGACTAMPTP